MNPALEHCPFERIREAVAFALTKMRPDSGVAHLPITREFAEVLAAGHHCAGGCVRSAGEAPQSGDTNQP